MVGLAGPNSVASTAGGSDTGTTALQNLVIAFNSVNKTLQYINGQFTSDTYPSAGLSTVRIYHGRCRIVSVTVLVTGGTANLYDSSTSTVTPASALKFTVDSTATVGVHLAGIECTNGLVLNVTAPSEVNVTYSVY